MCASIASDQLEFILYRDSVEIAKKYSEEEADLDIPRDIVLRSTVVPEKLRTALLNHLIQFRQKYNVSEFIILKTYHIFETVISKLSPALQDLEKFAMCSLSLMIKFEGQIIGSVEDFTNLCSRNFSVSELNTIERDILLATNFKLHVTSPADVVFLISEISGQMTKFEGFKC